MIAVHYKTDIGRKRAKNQDSAGIFPDQDLYIVADGMGGHRGGEVASQMAVEIASQTFIQESGKTSDRQKVMQSSAKTANAAIMKRSQNEKELEGMGTTLTFLNIHKGVAYIGHVGDSRCYLIRPEGIWQLTRDHSLVQEKLRAGMITREQLRTDRMKNVITRSVGFDANLVIDVYEYFPQIGDIFLMCSDGLCGQVDDDKIHEVVIKEYWDPASHLASRREELMERAISTLIDLANAHGGEDNCTVLLAHYLRKDDA